MFFLLKVVIMSKMKVSLPSAGIAQPLLVRRPVVEQAMAWLIEHGPLISAPPLPLWALHRLVKAGRIAHIRRDLYVAPHPDGTMPSAEELVCDVDPQAYVSFSAALAHHGHTDQDPVQVIAVSPAKQWSFDYGPRQVMIVPGSRSLGSPDWDVMSDDHGGYRLATVQQAFIDALARPALGPPVSTLVRVVQTLARTDSPDLDELVQRVGATDSPVLARRLGLLLELATGTTNFNLLAQGHRNHTTSRFGGERIAEHDPRWRIDLPMSKEQILQEAVL